LRIVLKPLYIFTDGIPKFGKSWAARFWRRHKLSCRIATTKMREIPADFEVKKANYLSVATNIIRQLNIPKQLNYALDETNVMFVSRASRTRSKKGSKRVRLIGIGKDIGDCGRRKNSSSSIYFWWEN
jgi:hypothetical protein